MIRKWKLIQNKVRLIFHISRSFVEYRIKKKNFKQSLTKESKKGYVEL